VAAVAEPRLGEFKPQNLANTAWAFATAGHSSPRLFEAVAAAAVPRLGGFKPQELANTAWAFAVADIPAASLFDSRRFVQCCTSAEHAFTPKELCQLHQWQLWLDERGAPWPSLPQPLAERCHAAFAAV